MQANSGGGTDNLFGAADLSNEHGEPTSLTRRDSEVTPSRQSEHHYGRRPCPDHGTASGKDRPIHRSRAAPGDGDKSNVKLRNSCRSCADSKVRCDREKPRCSRCASRDLPCEYLQSKRPGRIPGASLRQKHEQKAAKRSSHADSTAEGGEAHANSNTDGNLAASPFRMEDFTFDLSQQHTRTPVRGSPSTSRADGNTAASSPGSRDTELGGSFAGNAPVAPMATLPANSNMEDGMDFNVMDTGDGEPGGSYACNAPIAPMSTVTTTSTMGDPLDLSFLGMDAFWPNDYGNFVDFDPANFANVVASPHAPHLTAFTMSSHSDSDLPSLSSSSSNSNHRELLGTSAVSAGVSNAAIAGPCSNSGSSSCTCMMRALETLGILSSNESSNTTSEHYTQRVLLSNKEAIDASLAVLACGSCNNDRFVLMILLMTAAKVLTRYASAAALCRSQTSSNMPEASIPVMQTSSLSNHTNQLMEISRAWGGVSVLPPAQEVSGENQTSCREAVQRVLRELHLVQRLLVQLALRRRSLRGEDEGRAGSAGWTDNSAGSLMMRHRSGSHTGGASAVLTPHLHDNALGLVEDDVRNGLGVLSAVIRDLLNNS